LFYRICCKLS